MTRAAGAMLDKILLIHVKIKCICSLLYLISAIDEIYYYARKISMYKLIDTMLRDMLFATLQTICDCIHVV